MSNTASATRTLLGDWAARRQRLLDSPSGDADYRAVELRLLDFLLRRYAGTVQAAQPARFPLRGDVFIDHRAIIVHHHLGRGRIPAIANRHEADQRVRAMVERMWPPAGTRAELSDAAEESCWESPPPDPAEEARMKLCDNDALVRLQAAVRLGQLGDLDDIGLLADLLSLPPSPDEHPCQREALLHAMRRLSGETAEPYDLAAALGLSPAFASMATATAYIIKRAKASVYSWLLLLATIIFLIGIMAMNGWLGLLLAP
jgi:hypothetical protein